MAGVPNPFQILGRQILLGEGWDTSTDHLGYHVKEVPCPANVSIEDTHDILKEIGDLCAPEQKRFLAKQSPDSGGFLIRPIALTERNTLRVEVLSEILVPALERLHSQTKTNGASL